MVAAKRAGYTVTAIDTFADQQTSDLADKTILVDYQNGFNSSTLLAAISSLDGKLYCGLIYGSGFEAQPELLVEISKTIPLLGNLASTVQAVKDPAVFFSSLEKCGIRFPATSYAYPNFDEVNFLRKKIGGCGGTHITYANQTDHSEHCYYQQFIDGRSVSLLFLANHHDIEVMGFNEQWINPSISEPFRYGGAVSNIDLPLHVQQQLINAAKKLTQIYDLVGLNSLDAILKDDLIFVLEINPRLSATIDLYDNCPDNLIEKHIKNCLSNSENSACVDAKKHLVTTSSKAHAIVYIDFNFIVPINFEWPDWVVDTPNELAEILSGEPLCTVLAEADSAEETKQLANIRVKIMQLEISKTTEPKNN